MVMVIVIVIVIVMVLVIVMLMVMLHTGRVMAHMLPWLNDSHGVWVAHHLQLLVCANNRTCECQKR
jgi:hypothetical protein